MFRFVEAYVGEYASGKSENAINRAIEIKRITNEKVTLVDLDTVEPFYTLRSLKKKLKEQYDIDVVTWETSETMGLGEAGSIIKPEMRWVLRREGNIVLDIGYGVHGAKILNLIEGANESEELKIFAVINTCRPITGTVQDIVEYVQSLGRIDGIVNNTNLGDDTTKEVIIEGEKIIEETSKILGIPIIYNAVNGEIINTLGSDDLKYPVKEIKRFMPDSMW
ncbi:hypothetical protein SAMN02745227_01962 [Anaerobranca californiensis DSM 14826]|jgi:hypothetical protein|uniref:Uncharacterized protein n=1 Tax=Anaerobranca californiensis DSM 14826 TaxID=1120989 RepID=A0A1M6R6J8_9FIRM|nr:hypothetical protein [Anaerobranca californiensis]SHK28046.1 hypothetical protein SAMN02745227_01962 [Anaerobranca californiensis DSM 14826]